MTQTITRRLVITASKLGFTARTEWTSNGLDWRVLSETFTETFPLLIVNRVADRADYAIVIK